MTRPRQAALLIALLILALYGRTLGYGLVWDDFAALRHRSTAELVGAWTGGWDPSGVWPVFYRPMSIVVYDTMFRLFAHHGAWLHLVNLLELWLAACLLRVFVERETASGGLALIAAVLLVLHPETPTSLAAWISQQFHLVALLWVLAAMLAWQRRRTSGASGWRVPLAALTMGVLMKEDVLMVAPALVVWQAIRARTVGDTPSPSRTVFALVGGWIALYVMLRTAALGAIGGYESPSFGRWLLNIVDGPLFAFGMLWIPSAHGISVLSALGVAALLWLMWRARRHATSSLIALGLYGITLGVLANVPLVLVSGHTRLYLMTLGATLAMTAAIGIVMAGYQRTRGELPRWVVGGALAWAIVMAMANWANTNTFAPCAPEVMQRNEEALSWDITSEAARAGILQDMAACTSLTPHR